MDLMKFGNWELWEKMSKLANDEKDSLFTRFRKFGESIGKNLRENFVIRLIVMNFLFSSRGYVWNWVIEWLIRIFSKRLTESAIFFSLKPFAPQRGSSSKMAVSEELRNEQTNRQRDTGWLTS